MPSVAANGVNRRAQQIASIPATGSDPTTDAAPPKTTIHPRTLDAAIPSALGLHWSVIAVGPDDVLNVLELPNETGAVVGRLLPRSSNFWVSNQVQITSSTRWRYVTADDGKRGWVDSRFLVAQPADLSLSDARKLEAMAAGLSAWIRGDSPIPGFTFAKGALWLVDGVSESGLPQWRWAPKADLMTRDGWDSLKIAGLASRRTPCRDLAVHCVATESEIGLLFDWSSGTPALLAYGI